MSDNRARASTSSTKNSAAAGAASVSADSDSPAASSGSHLAQAARDSGSGTTSSTGSHSGNNHHANDAQFSPRRTQLPHQFKFVPPVCLPSISPFLQALRLLQVPRASLPVTSSVSTSFTSQPSNQDDSFLSSFASFAAAATGQKIATFHVIDRRSAHPDLALSSYGASELYSSYAAPFSISEQSHINILGLNSPASSFQQRHWHANGISFPLPPPPFSILESSFPSTALSAVPSCADLDASCCVGCGIMLHHKRVSRERGFVNCPRCFTSFNPLLIAVARSARTTKSNTKSK